MLTAGLIGCGRIGAGWNWPAHPYVYTHLDAYKALFPRVDLKWAFDTDPERAETARKKSPSIVESLEGLTLQEILRRHPVDVVSVSTPPEAHADILDMLVKECPGLGGIWCEKPLSAPRWSRHERKPPFVQVNYIRRFDPLHRMLAGVGRGMLSVHAKMDTHTVCHFTDLARFWGLSKGQLVYEAHDGPCEYEYACDGTVISWKGGGVLRGFMERALSNLLDAMKAGYPLVSPASNAVESERWADEILEAANNVARP